MSRTIILALIASIFLCLSAAADPPSSCEILNPTESSPFYVVPDRTISVRILYSSLPQTQGTTYATIRLSRSSDDSFVQEVYENVPDGNSQICDIEIVVPAKDPYGIKVDGWLKVTAVVMNSDGSTKDAIQDRAVFVDWVKPSEPGVPDIITDKPTHNPRPTWTWSPSTDNSGVLFYKVKLGTTPGSGNIIGGSVGVIATSNIWTQSASFTSSGTYYLTVWAVDGAGNKSGEITSDALNYTKPIYVWKNSPGPTHDGSSWNYAFTTITDGLAAASSGDEIWVAAGNYPEPITHKGGVGIYGGFAGTETAREQRNWLTNASVIDGSSGNVMVTIPSGVTNTCVLDGFTVRNGGATGHETISIGDSAAPVIQNNLIGPNNNNVISTGQSCSAKIQYNIFSGNNVCSIYVRANSPITIASNIFANGGTGIKLEYLENSPVIVNNTFVNLSGTGLLCYRNISTIANNIFAFCNKGIYALGSGPSPTLINNCFYGNNTNYSGLEAGTGDFYEDPEFVDRLGGDFHLTASSPCLNAGSNSAPGIPAFDIDGNARIYDGIVDVGADEFSSSFVHKPVINPAGGTFNQPQNPVITCDTPGAVIHYTTNGNTPTESDPVIASGSSLPVGQSLTLKAKAFKTGLPASGTTSATFTMVCSNPTFSIPGGYYTSPQDVVVSCATPNVEIHYTTTGYTPTLSDPIVPSGGTLHITRTCILKAKAFRTGWTTSQTTTAIYRFEHTLYVKKDTISPIHDGFSWNTAFTTIGEALNIAIPGDEIWVAAGRYVENLTMKDAVALYGGFKGTETTRSQRDWRNNETIIDGNNAGSVITSLSGVTNSARVDGFTITGGSDTSGGGINCYGGSLTIINNKIKGNHAVGNGYIVGGGISISYLPTDSTALVINNFIYDNTAVYGGGGIATNSCRAQIINNTIVNNTAGTNGGGVFWTATPGEMENNIIAFNSSGIYLAYSYPPTFQYNCVFGNIDYQYVGCTGYHDIMENPSFVDLSNKDFHITSSSPCRNAGYNLAPSLPAIDADGQERIEGSTVDIGADEYWDPLATPTFDPDGGISNQTIYVTISCATPGATIHYTTNGLDPTENDPVIASGWYIPINSTLTLKARAFKQFFEPSAVKSANYTIVNTIYVNKNAPGPNHDGLSWQTAYTSIQTGINKAIAGNTILVAAGTYKECITPKPGVSMYGGFAGTESELWQRDWVANKTIIDGNGTGPVVTFSNSYSQIFDGFVITNGYGSCGGALVDHCKPTIINCVFKENSATSRGGGILCDQGADPYIANNIFYSNRGPGAAVYSASFSRPTIINNTIVGNRDNESGAIYIEEDSGAVIANNIIVRNHVGIASLGSKQEIQFNCVYGNKTADYVGVSPGIGDINLEPCFVDELNQDYHLRADSPCIDTAGECPESDFEGCIRPQDGDNKNGAAGDMGAYEYPLNLFGAKGNFDDGADIRLGGVSVTARFASSLYVEREDRSCGIRVDTYEQFPIGARVNVVGIIGTDPVSGERFIDPKPGFISYSMRGNAFINPLGMGCRSAGGSNNGLQKGINCASGLNNIGLLIKVWGKVTAVDPSPQPAWFIIADGSGSTVKCTIPAGAAVPAVNSRVSATGISSMEAGFIRSLVRTRSAEDIQSF